MGVYNNLSIFKNIVFSSFLLTPYKINFAVTSQCNSRCKTCNTWKNKKDISKELTIKEIDTIFKKLPRTVTWISLTGGEPFLRKDFAEILNSAIENIKSLKMITIPSNGLLKEKIIKILNNVPDFPIFLNFSIDGPSRVHDQIRGIKGGFKKTWDTYCAVLALSRKRKNLKAGIETTISSYNLPYIKPFLKKLLQSDHNVTLTLAQKGSLYSNQDMNDIIPKNEEKIEELVQIANKNLKIYNPYHYIERNYLNNIIPFLKGKNKDFRPKKCVAGLYSVSIDPFGNISPCLIWGKKIRNLRDMDYDLKKLGKTKIKEIRKIINTQRCPNCWTPCEAYQSIIMDTLKLNWG